MPLGGFMELIVKLTKEELQLLANALHVAVIHVDENEKAEKMNNLLKVLRPFSCA